MQTHLDGEEVPPAQVRDEGRRIVVGTHATLPALIEHGYITPEQRRELVVFTAVRNPFDDLVSLYEKNRAVHAGKLRRPEQVIQDGWARHLEFAATHSFEEWVLKVHVRKGALGRLRGPRTATYEHTEGVDRVLRFERLQEDFDVLLAGIGFEGRIELPRVNVTERGRDYRTYYSPAAREVVERAWSAELARYGYGF
jgi:hypothetical protein